VVAGARRTELKQFHGIESIAEVVTFLDTLYGDMIKRYDNMLAEVHTHTHTPHAHTLNRTRKPHTDLRWGR
jgi:hypothetical protein